MANFSAAAKRTRLLVGVIVGGLLLLAGLGAVVLLNKENQDLRQQAAGDKVYSCRTDVQCPNGWKCDGTTCLIPTEPPPKVYSCRNGMGCPAGMTCDGTTCIESVKSCNAATPCPSGFFCEGTKCLKKTAPAPTKAVRCAKQGEGAWGDIKCCEGLSVKQKPENLQVVQIGNKIVYQRCVGGVCPEATCQP